MHLHVACFYGIAGASSDCSKREENEKLTAAFLLRAAQKKDVPYIICTDLNLDPSQSQNTQKVIEAGLIFDRLKDGYGGQPPPTFCRAGLTEEITTTGNGATRIDTIFSNPAANHAIQMMEYLYTASITFDHVPLRIILNIMRFHDSIKCAVHPAIIRLPDNSKLSIKQRKRKKGTKWIFT